MTLKAKPGCCEEAALGVPGYIPCNKPATKIVGWKGRTDRPLRMCDGCADHNVKNRGGEVMGPCTAAVESLLDDELFKLLRAGTGTADDQRWAAAWIAKMSGFLTDAQFKLLKDGYDATDDEAKPVEDLAPYLIWSNEHRRWWGPGRSGYVTQFTAAGRYSRSFALSICRNALGTAGHIGMLAEIPVPFADVEEFLKGQMIPGRLA